MCVQAWAPSNSTELRLFASRPYGMTQYNSQMLEECMAHFNQHERLKNGNDIRLQKSIIDNYMKGAGSKLLPQNVRESGKEKLDAFLNAYERK